MNVEVTAPTEYQGTVLSGLTKRHAVITGHDQTDGYFSIFCEVSYSQFLYDVQLTRVSTDRHCSN